MIVDQATSHLQFINKSAYSTCELLSKTCDVNFFKFEKAEAVLVNMEEKELKILDKDLLQNAKAKEVEHLIEENFKTESVSLQNII